jgi:RNA polymerase sigma-70 factor (ECF subfamily)
MRPDAARAETPEVAGCLRAFETESDFVCRALRRQGVRAGDIEDLAQDVFVVLCRRWPGLDHERPLRPWLSGVIVKVAQQYRKREGRFVPVGLVDGEDPQQPADDQLGSVRARALVTRALARLPDKQRAVLIMHDLDGVPMREVAARLAVPLFTAYTRLRDGRRRLSATIEGLHPTRRWVVARALARLQPWWIVVTALVAVALGVALWPAAPRRADETDRTPPTRGLVGYWRFDGRAGTVALDSSGGGNDCVLRSTDGALHGRWVDGVRGGALALDGKAWLECPRVGRLAQLDTEVTIALWIRTSTGAVARQALVTRQLEQSGDRLFSLRLQGQRLEFLSHVWKTLLGRPYRGDGWTHVAAVRDAAGTRLYVDGVLVGRSARTTPGTIGGGTGPLVVGGQVNGPEPGPAQDRFRGSLDELLVYDRALPGREIAALAARVQPRIGQP